MVWVLVQSAMFSCDSTVNADWHCWRCWIFALSAVICPSLLIGVTPVLSVPKDFIYNSFFHHILLKILTKI
jgi:hypothetical protein